ncbi:MAG TPA: flagellar basal body-associated FliL family protein [Accumulibacter sp.]|uniref:flagellar basal body-associated FliL family protein n=1 Tax=Accumulibacter sp. TaxID=2053492 RepID=UPI002CC7E25E|nr:flagellar basal body-associated FliL family protein [Accumulibacter sp.]HND39209.1 flagellar basal body-associated FliL family protein [Accumulibacter sp.]HNN83112.1 flagellar basal body-associated FliL family protein [Accumulibacter sp.]
MATKDSKPAGDSAEATPAKSSKKLLIIIVAAVVLVLALGGTAAFFLLKSNPEHDEENGEAAVEKAKPVKKKKVDREAAPIYVALDAFTVNLVPENGDQFLQLIAAVEVEDAQTGDQLKVYMPKLRNDITLLLSSKKASELIAKEGKQRLAEEIKDQMNHILDPAAKNKKREGPIRDVLFTSFIIQ